MFRRQRFVVKVNQGLRPLGEHVDANTVSTLKAARSKTPQSSTKFCRAPVIRFRGETKLGTVGGMFQPPNLNL